MELPRRGRYFLGPLRREVERLEWRPGGARVRLVRGYRRRLECDELQSPVNPPTPAQTYLQGSRELVDVVESQLLLISGVADWFARSILAGRRVHVFGAEHSRIRVEGVRGVRSDLGLSHAGSVSAG